MEWDIIIAIIMLLISVAILSFCLGYINGFNRCKKIDDELIDKLGNKYKALNNEKMNDCKYCKHYEKCSENIYEATIEREYLIRWSEKDCWEMNEEYEMERDSLQHKPE